MTLTASQKQTLTELRREFETVLEERRVRDLRLAQLQHAINALTALDSDEPVTLDGTLTDACRAVLKNAGRPLTPVQVRDVIIAFGFDVSTQTNPLASIHSVLKRLAESGDVQQAKTTSGTKDETLYFWTGRAEAERLVSAMPFNPATYHDLNFMSGGSDHGTIAALMQQTHRRQSAAVKANYTIDSKIDAEKEK